MVAPFLLTAWKRDVPLFDGTDPNGWISRIEDFFLFCSEFGELTTSLDHVRLKMVSGQMEGAAASWFREIDISTPWPEFKEKLAQRFSRATLAANLDNGSENIEDGSVEEDIIIGEHVPVLESERPIFQVAKFTYSPQPRRKPVRCDEHSRPCPANCAPISPFSERKSNLEYDASVLNTDSSARSGAVSWYGKEEDLKIGKNYGSKYRNQSRKTTIVIDAATYN